MSDNFTFNGKHSLDDMGIYVESIKSPLFAEPKTIYEDIPGADGELNFTANNPKERMCFKPRIIELECHFAGYNENRRGYLQKISEIGAWLATNEDKQLIFDSMPSMCYKAHAANLFNVQDITDFSGTFPLVFKCDPFRYNINEASYSGSKSITITNKGYYTPPTINISGSAPDGIKITHNESGKSLSINTSLNNTTVVIDTEKMTVMANGISILQKCNGDFFEFVPGKNTVLIEYGSSGSIKTIVKYTQRYL